MRDISTTLSTHRDGFLALSLVGMVLVAGATRMAVGVCGVYHDDAIYVSTAKALADGDGYRLIGVPGAPRQTKYPVLHPALLSLVWTVWPEFPDNLLVMQALSLVAGALAVGLAYMYLVRCGYFSARVAFAACVCCAVSSGFLYFCTLTMAEMLFALSVVVGLWGIDTHIRKPSSNVITQLGIGALAAFPFLVRTIGAPVIPVTLWLLYRSGQRLRWYLVGISLVALPWILWSMGGRGIWEKNPVDGYYTDYLGCWSTTGFHLLGRVVAINSVTATFNTTELCLGNLASLAADHCHRGLSVVIMFGPGIVCWLAIMRGLREHRLLPYAVTTYLLIVLVWSWPPYRFLVPLLPFLLAYLFAGASAAALCILPRSTWRGIATLGVLSVLVANTQLLAQQRAKLAREGYPRPRLTGTSVQWSSYQDMFAWVRQNSDEKDVIASGVDSMLSLYTQRRAVRPIVYRPDKLFYTTSSEPLITTEQLVTILLNYDTTFLVQCPMPDFGEDHEFGQAICRLRAKYPNWLHVAYQGTDQRFVIYRLDPAHAPARSGEGHGIEDPKPAPGGKSRERLVFRQ